MSRGFSPVFLPEGRQLNGKASQTFLRHYNQCPRSAFYYLWFKGEASSIPMVRGTALHLVAQRMTDACVSAGEPVCPPELVKAIAEEVLLELPVPIEEHDYLREMSYRLGSEWTIDPAAVIACETLFALDVGGVQVRAKIDYAGMLDDGARIEVVDFKSARAAVSYEDISRKRADGTFAAKSFQLILYALAIVFGVPVREETHLGERVEVLEPYPVAGRAQEVFLEYVYPGIEMRDGLMMRRGTSLTRAELEVYRQSLGAMISRLKESERTGDWPAIVSDAACSECPAAPLCPIPVELRDHAGTINTAAEAAEALEVCDRTKARSSAIRREVKNFAKHHGIAIRFGADKEARFIVEESEKWVDRDEMFEAVRRAVEYGEPFERSDFVRTVQGTKFADVRLSEDELAAEAAESEA